MHPMRSLINRVAKLNEAALSEAVDPTAYGWKQTGSGQITKWAKEKDGRRPSTASPSRYQHPDHPGHQLEVYPMKPPIWRHDRPSGKTMTIRGRTMSAGPETVASGRDARSLGKHLADFHK